MIIIIILINLLTFKLINFFFSKGVTTMLNFFTTSNSFRGTLPVVSNLTAMNVWDGVCMCFIYASLLEFVCVNYVGRKRPLHNVVYRPGENPVTQVRFHFGYSFLNDGFSIKEPVELGEVSDISVHLSQLNAILFYIMKKFPFKVAAIEIF